eukprot:366269-Chlamydomonas_euryale.AAC.11
MELRRPSFACEVVITPRLRRRNTRERVAASPASAGARGARREVLGYADGVVSMAGRGTERGRKPGCRPRCSGTLRTRDSRSREPRQGGDRAAGWLRNDGAAAPRSLCIRAAALLHTASHLTQRGRLCTAQQLERRSTAGPPHPAPSADRGRRPFFTCPASALLQESKLPRPDGDMRLRCRDIRDAVSRGGRRGLRRRRGKGGEGR